MAVDKLNILLKQKQKLFHTSDLALLWNIQNTNTLYTAVKRFVQKGVLFPVHKGLYSVLPLNQLDPIQLGFRAIHRYAYLSTESVLSREGVISQVAYQTTFVSDISRTFKIENNCFLVRKLQAKFLHNTIGIVEVNDGFFSSTLERAIADMLYFQPKYHFDGSSMIDWEKVKSLQKKIGYL